jgi:hypothetical protein
LRPADRERIIEEQHLRHAPREAQRFFWQRHQVQRRRRPVDAVGGWLDRAAAAAAGAPAGMVAAAAEAWGEILPADYAGRARVEGLRGRCLEVVVDSSSTRYVLERQLSAMVIGAMNERLGAAVVERMRVRVGRPGGGGGAARGRGG